ncbi:MAG: DUF3090 family protein [Phototrophicaceae bacterium]
MPNLEIELKPVDFITIGTIGPKGKRMFHLQAGQSDQLITLLIEKEQAWALSEAIDDLVKDLDGKRDSFDIMQYDMELREPLRPIFRVSQMGIGFDEADKLIVIVAQEMVIETQKESGDPSVVRFWCSKEQMLALSIQAKTMVQAGRADPRMNGRLVYYWT